MRATKTAAILAVLLLALGAPSMAADDPPGKVQGEVVQVMQQTGNAGELDTLMIRTRQGEQIHLALGEAGSSEGRVQVGDQVSARLTNGEPTEQGYPVQSMKVRRTGETLQYRDASGQMLQTRTRARVHAQDGTGPATGTRTQTRARVHEPGTGNCPNGGGSRGNRGGGGGRR
jgi:hypothetical protein